LKIPVLLSFLISLIFTVMGILILSGVLFPSPYFSGGQEYLRTLFGAVFILYGVFRGVNGYLKMKRKGEDDGELL
jgi:hypothetical protein